VSDAAIELQDLRFRWPRAGADCLAIERLVVAPGERLFLHGPSGCGKSTLLALLAGVLLPREGRLALLGTDWAALSAARRGAFRAEHVGVLFQQFNLMPWLPVLDNVLLGCRFSHARSARAAQAGGTPAGQARALLDRVGIAAPLWTRAARELSVGQQQRVAAARALIGWPGVLIADEPTSALDAALRDGFMDLLLAECRAAGSALVFVSHDDRLAAHFDRTLSLPALNGAAS
jgi:putative ABC transport system ATP-binding protein